MSGSPALKTSPDTPLASPIPLTEQEQELALDLIQESKSISIYVSDADRLEQKHGRLLSDGEAHTLLRYLIEARTETRKGVERCMLAKIIGLLDDVKSERLSFTDVFYQPRETGKLAELRGALPSIVTRLQFIRATLAPWLESAIKQGKSRRKKTIGGMERLHENINELLASHPLRWDIIAEFAGSLQLLAAGIEPNPSQRGVRRQAGLAVLHPPHEVLPVLYRIQATRARFEEAKLALLAFNIGLVKTIAKGFQESSNRRMSFADLMQAGADGFFRSLETIKYRGKKFSTYPTEWIINSMESAMADYNPSVLKMSWHMRKRYLDIERRSSSEDPDKKASVHADEQQLLQAGRHPISIHGNEESDVVGLESDIADKRPGPEELFVFAQLPVVVDQVLAKLKPREEIVIRLLYGLDYRQGLPTGLPYGKPHTLEKAGEHLKLTKEGVRQIEAKAIRKLQLPQIHASLIPYVEEK